MWVSIRGMGLDCEEAEEEVVVVVAVGWEDSIVKVDDTDVS